VNRHISINMLGVLGLVVTSLATAQTGQAPARDAVEWALLDNYCSECHNFDDQAGGIAFEILSRDSLKSDAATWEKALRKLRTGLMPPSGKERPAHAELGDFIAHLESRLDTEQSQAPNPGDEGMGRLNRAEYINVIRDLLHYDASGIVATLPPDEAEDGFDNLATTLTVSPTLIEAYVGTAMRISREAVGDRAMIPTQIKYPAPGGSQTQHREGLPLGTRGGMLVTHNFPLNAQYEIRINTQGAGGIFNNQAFCSGPSVVVTLNGQALEIEDPASFQLEIPAGPQTFGAALIDDKRCEGVNEFYDVYAPGGAISGIEVHGPFDVQGPGNTPSRDTIFSCTPEAASEQEPCARQILSTLATRAYRHPVDADSPELDTLMQFFALGTTEGDFETGVQYALSRLLIDPQFLYQAEAQPAGLADGSVYRITDLELATRLAFFLWSSIPDTQLLALAADNRLSDPDILEAQVKRMLEDDRAYALVENFAGQWLRLRELDTALPQDNAFTASLRDSYREETERLFYDLIREDRSLLHLLNADYTWLNAELAAIYGIDNVRGAYMRKVALPESSPRRGLLGQGSILTATSVANRTSPVIRGEWIVENILGAPVPVPPPGVETDLSGETVPAGRVVNTLRDRLELHRENPTCAACHQVMDPVGFALENFDLIGRWREEDSGYPVNPVSALVDGTPIASPQDLRKALLARGDTVATAFTEKLLTYALGRSIEYYDMPAVRKIMAAADTTDYRFSTVILGIVASLPFQYKSASTNTLTTAGP